MKDQDKTKKLQISELMELRQRTAELEKLETDRKEMEGALKTSELRFRRLFETAQDGILIVDAETGVIEVVNPFLLDMLGYSHEEFLGKKLWEIGFFKDIGASQSAFKELQEKEYVRYEDLPLETKKGRCMEVEFVSNVYKVDGKKVIQCNVRDITGRKVSKALRESEEKYLQVVENAAEAILVVQDGMIRFLNHNTVELMGYSKEELISRPFLEFIHPEDREMVLERHLRRLRGEALPRIYSFRVVDKDGDTKWAEINVTLISWEGMPATLNFLTNITERKQAEISLRESKERYRELFDGAPVGYSEYDIEGRITSVNRTELEMLGYSPEEMTGQPMWKFIIEEEEARQQILAKLAGTMPPGRAIERTYRRKDGTTFPVLVEDRLIRDGNGRITGIRCTLQDITQRKQREEALRISEEKYRTILEDIEDGYYEVDTAGNFTFLNDSMCRIYGYPREELMGMNNRQYTDQENAKKLFKAFNRVYRTGESTKEFGWEIVGKDGTKRCIETSISLIKDSSGNRIGFRGIIRDITERKRAEEERGKMQAQLIQAQKMESIGTLAGGVAHDFNNLLTTIQGYAQLAMMSLKEGDPFYENFKEIQQASVRAAKLTRQLLLFSRQQPMDLHSMTLNETVDNLMKMLKRLIGENMTVQTDLDPNLWRNMADPGNMEQVIMNLVVNARDAMPEGGTIRIKTENLNIDKDYCEINIYARPGKFTCLSVEDTGVGMDKEIIQHIFEPFFTTKGVGKGTGIGLSVVHGIVKQNEGWINVYSEPGRGSAFKVYLPVSFVESKGEAKEEVISIQDCHGKGERILLVEDDDGIREFAKRVLVESGYVGFEAANAEEALSIFGKEKGDFCLVFSDVVLPEKSGLQLVEQLLCRKPELKVLLTSGYTDQKSQWPVICEKGYRFIQKPYGLTELLRVVREVIEQGK